jgi:hypothetical protein
LKNKIVSELLKRIVPQHVQERIACKGVPIKGNQEDDPPVSARATPSLYHCITAPFICQMFSGRFSAPNNTVFPTDMFSDVTLSLLKKIQLRKPFITSYHMHYVSELSVIFMVLNISFS